MMLLLSGVHSECLVQQRNSTLSDDVTVVGGFTPNAWCSNEGTRFQMMLLLLGIHSECLVQPRNSTLSDYCLVHQRRSTLSDDVTVVGVQSECLVQQQRSTLTDDVTVAGGSLRMPGAPTEEARLPRVSLRSIIGRVPISRAMLMKNILIS